ncbi:response regulator [Roseofilum sp. BLCC_M91]|uniref:histidine kinase n=1 Tax=Roseofilum halophilum BLCC-M91 TaxID=3022259 RepID=A0ABT7BPH7_9CYAN|nr:response regulator [Roseofilum halophilum]MDJ1181092.1 response regulator [Roseofilum halophilum BLCC-M91]
MSSKRAILCVDDNPIILDSLKRQLKAWLTSSYLIEQAESGIEALEIAQDLIADRIDIALIISDHMMPGMSGDELLIKVHDLSSKTLKILLTGQASADVVGRVVNHAKLYRYIAKPWDEEDLKLTVTEALRSYDQDQKLAQQNKKLQLINAELTELNQDLEKKVSQRTQELEQAKQTAELANRAKSEFLANMSHELRSPLNVILGFCQLMGRSSSLPAEHQENLRIMNRSGQHLLTLINNVLDLSKIEAGRITLDESCFDFMRLIDDLEGMFKLKAKQKNIELFFDISPKVPYYICTDQVKLRQILINLLNNSLKFTEEGHVSLRISTVNPQVDPSSHKVVLQVEVEDTGPGIAPEEQQKLFEAFVQSKRRKVSQEGTGLGLTIAQKFVQLMQGTITLESQVGYGSKFQFTIEVFRVSSDRVLPTHSSHRVVGLAPEQPVYRILIVDDQWENRQLLLQFLEPIGFEVKLAENGHEAIALWETWKPHLIWMDIRMPVMNGDLVTEYIIANTPATEPAPIIIALTASILEEELDRILSVGCHDCVLKPFTEDLIFEKIAEYLGVRYIYDHHSQELQEKSLTSSPSAFSLTSNSLKVMPHQWLQQLYQAADAIDDDRLLQLIDQIPDRYSTLAQSLTDLVKTFRCDQILSLIEDTQMDNFNADR